MGNAISITLSLLAFLAIIFTPVLTGLMSALIISIRHPRYYRILPILLIALFIALNLAKEPSGDYVWYSQHYVWLANGSLLEYFNSTLYGVSAKITEPVYYIYTKILSLLSSGNIILFVITTTAIIYALYSIAIVRLSYEFGLDEQSRATFLVAGLTLCITFTLTNHLIRQYIASAIFILFISCAHERKWGRTLFAALAASLTHNTIIIPIVLIIAAIFISRQPSRKATFFYVTLIIPMPALFGNWLVKIISSEHDILSLTDGSISIITLFFDAACFVGLIVSYQLLRSADTISKNHKDVLKSVVFFYLLYISLLVGISDSPLLLLRYYFYIEPIRVLAFLSIVKSISCAPRTIIRPLALTAILTLGLAHTGMRMETSPFNYGMKFQNYMSEDIYSLLSKYKILANNTN